MKHESAVLLTSRCIRFEAQGIDFTSQRESSVSVRARPRKLYRYGKISDRVFVNILDHFVRDHSASGTARATGLSVNSVNAIFRKIREFLYDVGAANDLNEFAAEHRLYSETSKVREFEDYLFGFHQRRSAGKRRLIDPPGRPMLHFAETCWRFHYHLMWLERRSDAIYTMMRRHLVELIEVSGPLGRAIENERSPLGEYRRHFDEIDRWLIRNASGYSTGLVEALQMIRWGIPAPRKLVADRIRAGRTRRNNG